jgi:hypothetical protein
MGMESLSAISGMRSVGAGTVMLMVVEPQSLESLSAEQLRSALLSMLQAAAAKDQELAFKQTVQTLRIAAKGSSVYTRKHQLRIPAFLNTGSGSAISATVVHEWQR